jgi:flagellar motor switch protein FliN
VDGRQLTQAIVEELAAVVAAVVGGDPQISDAPVDTSSVWNIRFNVQGAAKGTLNLAIPSTDASVFTGQILGFGDEVPEDAITDNLLESAKQAAGSLNVKEGSDGAHLTVVEPVMTMASPGGQATWVAAVIGTLTIRMAVTAAVEEVARAAAPQPAAPDPMPAPRQAPSIISQVPANLDLILDIDLPLWVRFGETMMTIQALSKVGPGATIELDRSPDDPVDVLGNDTVIARGEVVVVQGNYGVRVTEVVSAQERIRSMGPAN